MSDSSRGAFCYDLMKCFLAGNIKEEDGSIYFVKLCSQSAFYQDQYSSCSRDSRKKELWV